MDYKKLVKVVDGERYYLPINGKDVTDDWVYSDLCSEGYDVINGEGKPHLVEFTRGGQKFTITWEDGGNQFTIEAMDDSNWAPIDEYFAELGTSLDGLNIDLQKGENQYIVRFY